jgi:predicted RNA-binding protein YlqC (UPF0109 family)
MLSGFFRKIFAGKEDAAAPAADVQPAATATTAPAAGPTTADGDLVRFVEYVVRSLVDSPEAVEIATDCNDKGTVITISCSKDQVGKIIGRNGRTIGAIRALVRSAAGRLNQSATVVVAD